MEWVKRGQIYFVNNDNEYLITHASNPLAIHIGGDNYRVFFSGRNKDNKSSVSYVDINIITQEVICVFKEPVAKFGHNSSFYSHGISIGNMYKGSNKENYILFMGWQIEKGKHWRGDIGRIKLMDNSTMQIEPDEPFMGIDDEDKISLSYPCVLYHDGIYKMWYGSTIDWSSSNGEMIHVIKYATSTNGIDWEKHGIAIEYKLGVAQAFSKPSVIIDKNGYHMWYSFRNGIGRTYRIGYSNSKDGINWHNHFDNSGINVSTSGWDSEMICYPYVFDHKGKRYMLYNGNSFGKEGFGLAILK